MAFVKRLLVFLLVIICSQTILSKTENEKKISTNTKTKSCGQPSTSPHGVCKPAVQNNTTALTNSSALRQCVPFIPPACPCAAQNANQGPTCSADVQLGFVVPVSTKQPIVDIEVSTFIKSIVSRFHLAPHRTQIGVVTYGTIPKMAFTFNRFSCKRKVLHQLGSLGHLGRHGRPRLGKALTYADQHLFSTESTKSKALVVLTEHSSYDDVSVPAQHLRMNKVRMLAVGLGRYINGKQLDDIVDKPAFDNIFSSGHAYLHLMTDKIVKNICLGAGGFLEDKSRRPCLCAVSQPHHK